MAKDEKKFYKDGPGKPPIFIQAIIDNKEMSAIDFFHITDMYLNWDAEDDEAIVEPLIDFLAEWGDDLIYAFDDRMAQLLYDIDTKAVASKAYKDDEYMSPDMFLYNRCVALINSKPFYNQVHNGKRKLNKDCEFEIILYVPARAWAKLHNKDEDEYYACHETPVCVETYSNEVGWQIE